VFLTDTGSGVSTRLTARSNDESAPRPEACVFSPDGHAIAFVRRIAAGGQLYNQIGVVFLD